jgi:hypothetical protein
MNCDLQSPFAGILLLLLIFSIHPFLIIPLTLGNLDTELFYTSSDETLDMRGTSLQTTKEDKEQIRGEHFELLLNFNK